MLQYAALESARLRASLAPAALVAAQSRLAALANVGESGDGVTAPGSRQEAAGDVAGAASEPAPVPSLRESAAAAPAAAPAPHRLLRELTRRNPVSWLPHPSDLRGERQERTSSDHAAEALACALLLFETAAACELDAAQRCIPLVAQLAGRWSSRAPGEASAEEKKQLYAAVTCVGRWGQIVAIRAEATRRLAARRAVLQQLHVQAEAAARWIEPVVARLEELRAARDAATGGGGVGGPGGGGDDNDGAAAAEEGEQW